MREQADPGLGNRLDQVSWPALTPRLCLRRVTAGCFADHDASWRIMQRLGMRRERHAVRDSLHASSQWLDSLGYALLAEEWHRGSC